MGKIQILITGGFGFIGLNILGKILTSSDDEVLIIDRNVADLSNARVNIVANTITDTNWINKKHDIESVVLLAGISGKNVEDEKMMLELNVRANVELTKRLLKNSDKNLHVIIPSSQLVYENTVVTDETINISPDNIYARSKLELEKQLLSLSTADKRLTVTSFRISNPFGPHIPIPQNYNYANQMLLKLWNDEIIQLFHYGKVIKNYIPIQNVVKVILETINRSLFKNEIVNLGYHEEVEMKKFYTEARRIMGKGSIELIEGGDVDNIRLNTEKLYSVFDKNSLITQSEALLLFKEFFDKHTNISIKEFISEN